MRFLHTLYPGESLENVSCFIYPLVDDCIAVHSFVSYALCTVSDAPARAVTNHFAKGQQHDQATHQEFYVQLEGIKGCAATHQGIFIFVSGLQQWWVNPHTN